MLFTMKQMKLYLLFSMIGNNFEIKASVNKLNVNNAMKYFIQEKENIKKSNVDEAFEKINQDFFKKLNIVEEDIKENLKFIENLIINMPETIDNINEIFYNSLILLITLNLHQNENLSYGCLKVKDVGNFLTNISYPDNKKKEIMNFIKKILQINKKLDEYLEDHNDIEHMEEYNMKDIFGDYNFQKADVSSYINMYHKNFINILNEDNSLIENYKIIDENKLFNKITNNKFISIYLLQSLMYGINNHRLEFDSNSIYELFEKNLDINHVKTFLNKNYDNDKSGNIIYGYLQEYEEFKDKFQLQNPKINTTNFYKKYISNEINTNTRTMNSFLEIYSFLNENYEKFENKEKMEDSEIVDLLKMYSDYVMNFHKNEMNNKIDNNNLLISEGNKIKKKKKKAISSSAIKNQNESSSSSSESSDDEIIEELKETIETKKEIIEKLKEKLEIEALDDGIKETLLKTKLNFEEEKNEKLENKAEELKDQVEELEIKLEKLEKEKEKDEIEEIILKNELANEKEKNEELKNIIEEERKEIIEVIEEIKDNPYIKPAEIINKLKEATNEPSTEQLNNIENNKERNLLTREDLYKKEKEVEKNEELKGNKIKKKKKKVISSSAIKNQNKSSSSSSESSDDEIIEELKETIETKKEIIEELKEKLEIEALDDGIKETLLKNELANEKEKNEELKNIIEEERKEIIEVIEEIKDNPNIKPAEIINKLKEATDEPSNEQLNNIENNKERSPFIYKLKDKLNNIKAYKENILNNKKRNPLTREDLYKKEKEVEVINAKKILENLKTEKQKLLEKKEILLNEQNNILKAKENSLEKYKNQNNNNQFNDMQKKIDVIADTIKENKENNRFSSVNSRPVDLNLNLKQEPRITTTNNKDTTNNKKDTTAENSNKTTENTSKVTTATKVVTGAGLIGAGVGAVMLSNSNTEANNALNESINNVSDNV
jgi:hypothetical protein